MRDLEARPWTAIAFFVLLAATAFASQTAGTARSEAAEPRIVSLVPAVTEMLFDMGAGPLVVGVSSFDRHPPEVSTRARVGALVDPDLERILSLQPTLVVVYWSQEDLQRQLARASIEAFEYRHGGLAEITATMRALGARIGRRDDAERAAARLEAELAQTRSKVGARPRPRVMLVFGREPGTLRNVYASGGRGFLHEMLTAAGGSNVFEDVAREGLQVTTELVLARRPDVIVELRATGLTSPNARADRAWHTLGAVPAVRTGRIVVLDGDEMVVPGPRVGRATGRLAQALHPEAFR